MTFYGGVSFQPIRLMKTTLCKPHTHTLGFRSANFRSTPCRRSMGAEAKPKKRNTKRKTKKKNGKQTAEAAEAAEAEEEDEKIEEPTTDEIDIVNVLPKASETDASQADGEKDKKERLSNTSPRQLANAAWFWEGPQYFDGSRSPAACLYTKSNSSAKFQVDKSFVLATRIQIPSPSTVESGETGGCLFQAQGVQLAVDFHQPSPDNASVVHIHFWVRDGLSQIHLEHKMTRESLGQEGYLDICGAYWTADDQDVRNEVKLYVNEELQERKDASALEQSLPFEGPFLFDGYKGHVLRMRIWPIATVDGVHHALVDETLGCLTRMRYSCSQWVFAKELKFENFKNNVQKYGFDVLMKVLMQLAIFYADVITDILTILSFLSMGDNFAIYGYITLFILLFSPVTCWLVLWTSELAPLKDLPLGILQLTMLLESYDFFKRWSQAAKAAQSLHDVVFPKPSAALIWMAICEAVFEATSSSILQLYAAMEICLSFVESVRSGRTEDVLSEIQTLNTVFLSMTISFLSVSKTITAFSFYGREVSAWTFAETFLQNLIQIVSRMTSLALLAMVFKGETVMIFSILFLADWLLQLLVLTFGAQKLLRNGMRKSMFLFWSLFMLVIAPPAMIPEFADLHPVYLTIRVIELVMLTLLGFMQCGASEDANVTAPPSTCQLFDLQSPEMPTAMWIILFTAAISACGVLLICLKSWREYFKRSSQVTSKIAEQGRVPVCLGDRFALKVGNLPNRFLQAKMSERQWRRSAISTEIGAKKKGNNNGRLWIFKADEESLGSQDEHDKRHAIHFGDILRIASTETGSWLTGARRGGNEYVDVCQKSGDEERWCFDYDINVHYRWRVVAFENGRPNPESKVGKEVHTMDTIALQTVLCPEHFLSAGRGTSDAKKIDVNTVPLVGGAAEEDLPEQDHFPSFSFTVLSQVEVEESEEVRRKEQRRKELQYRRRAMVVAARDTDVMMMSLMMVSGVSFNVCNQQGLTPVHEFILRSANQEQHFGFFRSMLRQADLSIGALSLRYTPLHFACLLGRKKLCDALIAHQADVNAADADGFTCLHDAIRYGHPEVVQYLLNQEDINANASTKAGLLPLDLAILCRKKEIRFLLECHKAKSNFGGEEANPHRSSQAQHSTVEEAWKSQDQLKVNFVVPSREANWDANWKCDIDNVSLSGKPLVFKQSDGTFLCIFCARSAANPFLESLCKQYQCPRCDNISRIPYHENKAVNWACQVCQDYPDQVRMEPGNIKDAASEEAVREIKALFQELDANGDGYISFEELKVAVGDDEEEAKDLLERLDENGDKKLSLEEFTALTKTSSLASSRTS